MEIVENKLTEIRDRLKTNGAIQFHHIFGNALSKPQIDGISSKLEEMGEFKVFLGVNGNRMIKKDPTYKEPTERDKEIDELNFKKLKYEAKIAERTYNTFWWAFWISIGAFGISVISLILTLTRR
jgi:hypothetical protein